ncbi:type 4a pilus biogenesis protein PilO [Chitinivibrio alkaliphilus]|uniref:Pilus assembly protein PilO n=1 Tax=Chitinivibrio alkaliphilus ACht1 TaxID=1313304 RepID=U7D6N0_9BACT|nr:type 4a pilus biogenesis protein PilO [Chitinivibrio alkaliphilus]ERP31226.1 pilus assembly protein PilO [Chitinivibrio alkaliphilus ACht1]
MRKLTRNEQLLLVVLVGIAGLYFFNTKVHQPLSENIDALVEQNNQLVSEVEELRALPLETGGVQRAISRVSKEVAEVQEEYETELFARLPMRDRVEELGVSVGNIITQNGFELDHIRSVLDESHSVKGGPEQWRREFSLHLHTVRIMGNFMDFIRVLTALSAMERIVVLSDIVIKDPDVKGNVTIEFYLLL